MPDVAALRERLLALTPQHDNPLGVAHPYWARKPLNVVEAIVRDLSEEGDLVADPFMGSGTTVFGALKSGRQAVGGDISPLSHFIVAATVDLIINADVLLPELRRLRDEHRRLTLPWFELANGRHVERSRYDVVGEFAYGAFELRSAGIVTSEFEGSHARSRRASDDTWSVDTELLSPHLQSPVDFESFALPPNSRIAIPEGATLAHFFTPENRASINVYRRLVDQSPLAERHRPALEFPLSSAIPQLRLSDRKATSQWPYWRPRNGLTSRNPVRVLAERLDRVEKMSSWARDNGLAGADLAANVALHLQAAQALKSDLAGSAALVVTDPPYGDQVPYGEYAELWNGVLGLVAPASAGESELVRSNAPHRRSDSSTYLERLAEGFAANAALVRPGGFLVWFYQDQDLRCWAAIHTASVAAGVEIVDVIPIPKQRRSLKTVMSPGTTLDGDLVCVFRRPPADANFGIGRPTNVGGASNTSYFGRYASMIADALITGSIGDLAERYGTVKKALAIRE